MARKITISGGSVWELDENEAITLPHGHVAIAVKVLRGTVLVTQEGDPDDHVLEAGDALLLHGRGRVVAWAFTVATFSLNPVRRESLRYESGREQAA